MTMPNPSLVKVGRGFLVLALVGWCLRPRPQKVGIHLFAAVTDCGHLLHLRSATFPRQRCRTQRKAEGELPVVTSKLCSKCQSLIPVEEFYRNARSADGRRAWCRNCVKQYNKLWRQKLKAANKNRSRPPDDQQVFCPNCQRTLPAVDFSTHLMSRNRLKWQCRSCEKLDRLRHAAANEQRALPASFPVPSGWELQEAVGIENARDRNEALSRYGMYFCPRCRTAKSYEAFYQNKHQKHGVMSCCKECFGEWRARKKRDQCICACRSVLITLQLQVMHTIR